MCSSRVVFCVFLLLTGVVLPALCHGYKDVDHQMSQRAPLRRPSRRHRAANDGVLRFEPKPYSKKLELNTAGKIHCKVAGGVAPNVQWFLNDSDPLPEGVTSANGTLLISEAAKRHAGLYTCRAQDGDKEIKAAIQLDIVVSPRVLQPSPDQQVHVWAGRPALLPCAASGDPPPTTHWDRNLTILHPQQEGVDVEDGKNASNARFVLLNNGSLLLPAAALADSDRYGCTAGSAAGLARHELLLTVHPEGELLPSESNGVGGKAVMISILVAGAYMILVLALMLYCRRRRLKRRERGEKIELEMAEGREKLVEEEEDKQKKMGNGAAHNGRLLHDKDSGADNSELSGVSRASKRSGQYDHLAVPRSLITDQITLGRGEFGEVQLGKIDTSQLRKLRSRGDAGEPRLRPVLVKVLTAKDENILGEFRRQLELFTRVKHENVARVLGLCNEAEPHCLLLEHTDWGDLKTFLLATRSGADASEDSRTCPLSPAQLLGLSAQLARANVPLANNRLTHRDIAARNCLITAQLQLKLSCLAMSKGPHSQEYYKLHDRVIPLRWLPLEAVVDSEYSTKSDVYMFAATVWEIYSQAELPFVKLNDNSVMERLKAGTLQWSPAPAMPDKLVELLKRCWSPSPADRPQFTEICEEMKLILQDIPNDEVKQEATAENEP